MEYKPFVVEGKIRDFHISECEDMTFSELMEKDYYIEADDTERFVLHAVKCGSYFNLIKNNGGGYFYEAKDSFIKSVCSIILLPSLR